VIQFRLHKSIYAWLFFGIFAVTFISIVHPAYSAQPRLSKSALSSLLQQPTVSAIHRDTSGVLWIGTQQGLHKFDGAKVTVFNSGGVDKNWIPDSEIKDIAEGVDGSLFVATSGGVLLKWDREQEQFDAVTQFGGHESTKLVRLIISKRGDIWLLTKDGLILYDPKFDNTADWILDFSLPDILGKPHVIIEGRSEDLWVGGSSGIVRVFPKSKSLVSFSLDKLGLPNNSEITALEMAGNNVIIGTNTGHLVAWDMVNSRIQTHSTINGSRSFYISEILLYKNFLIIATDGGLFSSNKLLSSFEELGKKDNRPSESDVFSLYRDGEYIWVGTVDGLNILTFGSFELFSSDNSDISNHVLAFEEDQDGKVWIGTYSGLYYYDRTNESHVRITTSLDEKRVTTISTHENDLWLGYFQSGLEIVNLGTEKQPFSRQALFNGMAITKILSRSNEKHVWVATFNHGLFRVNAVKTYSYYKNNSLPEKSITVLFQSDTDIFLAVSENKIYIHDPVTDQFSEKHFEFDLGGKKPTIYSFAQAANDDIWIGTKDHGLYIWSREDQVKDLPHLKPAKGGVGLPTSTIYGIEIDSEGNLWCSTQNGIVKLDPEGLLIKRFTETDGLQGNDFAFGASFTSQNGLIYFGGVNGYNRFNPADVIIDKSASEMRLTGISFPKQQEKNLGPIAELKSLELTHKDHFTTFEFSVLDFIHPERNQFRYKLENFDPDWVENGTRNTATYTNLPAGDYTLRVQGANSSGIWNREGITLNIHVLPAPWFSWWANCIYVISVLLFIWGLARIYQSYEAKRTSKQLAIQMFEAENKADDDMQEQLELQDELIHSAYHHNRTILSLMGDCISLQGDVRRDFTVSCSKRIAALTCLEDSVFYQAGGPVANLKNYTDHILEYLLKNSPVNAQTIVTINEVSPKLLPAELALPLAIIIYELLENCIQHAFEVDSPANYIHITMSHQSMNYPSAYNLELFVRDSGSIECGSLEDLSHETSGLSIVQSIVDKLGGTLELSTDMSAKISLQRSDCQGTNISTDNASSG
jgi:ligand-binding sensor domain-containing protein/two-component sensor histidine kinase